MTRSLRRLLVASAIAALAVFAAAGVSLASGTASLSANKTQLKFSTKTLHASHGRVTIRMTNPSSSFKHGIAIAGHGKGRIVGRGGVSTVTATLKKGRYTFFCPVPGHRAAGMVGTLIVS
jgi:uncharacterized cupredoxin-like copper-binding protein